ncbi:MAG: aldose 1-epimerase family protein [Clostridia bacterium]|nr:aldose 1-epimerase family protein [Clostridia bacterium]
MSKTICISNNQLNVTISTLGAEMISIQKAGKELLWQGDPSVWTGHAPVLFPVCGGLKDSKFIFEGKEYTQPRHGFARTKEFQLEASDCDMATFLLTSDEETLKNYPFEFEFRITYKLSGTKLSVEYNIKNTTNKTMYFSVGSHEAYNCPEGIEEYSVIFEKPEDLRYNSLTPEGQLIYETKTLGDGVTELPLKYKYFEKDALVFTGIKSRKAVLKNNKTGYSIEVAFPGKDYFLLWTKPNGKYICLEPWCGITDFVDSNYDITKKKGINALEANQSFIREHTITF